VGYAGDQNWRRRAHDDWRLHGKIDARHRQLVEQRGRAAR
jgi:hypothetical protein